MCAVSDIEAVHKRCLLIVNVYLFYQVLRQEEWRVGTQGEPGALLCDSGHHEQHCHHSNYQYCCVSDAHTHVHANPPTIIKHII